MDTVLSVDRSAPGRFANVLGTFAFSALWRGCRDGVGSGIHVLPLLFSFPPLSPQWCTGLKTIKIAPGGPNKKAFFGDRLVKTVYRPFCMAPFPPTFGIKALGKLKARSHTLMLDRSPPLRAESRAPQTAAKRPGVPSALDIAGRAMYVQLQVSLLTPPLMCLGDPASATRSSSRHFQNLGAYWCPPAFESSLDRTISASLGSQPIFRPVLPLQLCVPLADQAVRNLRYVLAEL